MSLIQTAKEAGIQRIENKGNGVFWAYMGGKEIRKYISNKTAHWYSAVRYKNTILEYVATISRA